MMTQAEYIIGKFGGISAMAKAMRRTSKSTVQGWLERGSIPEWRYKEILVAAYTAGVDLKREDFVAHIDISECEQRPRASQGSARKLDTLELPDPVV